MYECDADVRRPVDARGDHRAPLRAYAAPGAGPSHRQADGVAVAGAHQPDHAADEAQALRDWGDFVHLNHIVEAGIPGFTMITPYENATGGDPRYLHFYEFDDPDAEVTFKRMRPMRRGAARRLGHAGVRGVGGAPGAADHVRQLVRARRRVLSVPSRSASRDCQVS